MTYEILVDDPGRKVFSRTKRAYVQARKWVKVVDSREPGNVLTDLASRVASGQEKPSHREDPGKGYWDGRLDVRTGYDTVHGAVVKVEGELGRGCARLRHESTVICPAGPCGQATEIVTWLEASAPSDQQ